MHTSNKPGSRPCACTTVKKVARVLGRTYDAALAGAAITVTQLAVLRCIARRPGEALSRVADELEMDRTSLYRALAPMARDGWIEVMAGPDARSRSARVTPQGAEVLANANAGWERTQEGLIGAFGPEAWEALVGELNRLAVCAEALG